MPLCSRAGGGLFKECSNEDMSGEEPTGQFPPIECTHCLPSCPAINGNASTPSTASAAPSQTVKASVPASSSAPTCLAANSSQSDGPASINNASGILYRRSCGNSDFTVAQCPYLCGEDLADGTVVRTTEASHSLEMTAINACLLVQTRLIPRSRHQLVRSSAHLLPIHRLYRILLRTVNFILTLFPLFSIQYLVSQAFIRLLFSNLL